MNTYKRKVIDNEESFVKKILTIFESPCPQRGKVTKR